ncbi:MAG: hypothetical protein ACREH5_06185, partial [Candidatus Omnitrophota bacterium]
SYLRTVPRAPRGYVVVRDVQGRPYAMMRFVAQKVGMWRPKQKPPISVRDWNSLRRSNSVIKKLQTMEKRAKKIANWKAPRRAPAEPAKGKK